MWSSQETAGNANSARAIEALQGISTGIATDALAKFGLLNQGFFDIRPISGYESYAVVGQAVTIRFAQRGHSGGANRPTFYDLMGGIVDGSVVCSQAAEGYAATGDVQLSMAKRAGMEAMIVDGGVRDLAGLRDVGVPVWAGGPATRLIRAKYEVAELNGPVVLGGVVVSPGDIIVADEDGGICIPQAVAPYVAEIRTEVEAAEERLEAAVRGGASPEEIAKKYADKLALVEDLSGR